MIKKHTVLTLLRPMMDALIGRDPKTEEKLFRGAKSSLLKAVHLAAEILPEYNLFYYNDEMNKRNLRPEDSRLSDFSGFDAQQICLLLTFLYREDRWCYPSEVLVKAIASGRISNMLKRLEEIDEAAIRSERSEHADL
ncbi:MAG: DUF6508 domain-containing protein [Akkermansia muciniphila]|nr:DUF6508 domain-containing protein [Akkermansia muciniphila]